MQVGQRVRVIEPLGLGHEALDQRQHPVGAVDEAGQRGAPIGAVIWRGLHRARLRRGRRPPPAAARPASGNTGSRNGRLLLRIVPDARHRPGARRRPGIRLRGSGLAGRRCASMKIAQPEPRRRNALFSRPVIATSSACVAESRSGPRNRAVRWNEPSLLRMTPCLDQRRPGQEVGQALAAVPVFGEVHHGRCLTPPDAAGSAGAGARHRRRRGRVWRPRRLPDGRSARWRRPRSRGAVPSPTAAASVPFRIATARGAPPSRIGSVSARWTGA